jgi:carboxyl-terminal processing protease
MFIVDILCMNSDHNRKRDRFAWSAIAALVILCSALSFSVVDASAQDSRSDNQRYFSMIQQAFTFILESYVDVVDPKLLYEGAMSGLFGALNDPYSSFLTEAMISDLNDVTTGQFGGIGLYISKPVADPKKPDQRLYVEVVSPIEDTPGWRAGIMPGDQITHINDEPTEPLLMDEVLKRLRGTPGTKVTITILRGTNLIFQETIERAMIEIPSIKRAMLPDGSGYLRIIEFQPQTVQRVREALEWFKSQNYKGLVIDLRNNPGGLLQSVVQVADLFLPGGTIVSTKARNPRENAVYTAKPPVSINTDMPIIVLINRGSASASEILAGALKDNKRAYLIGENTYGKGSVQLVLPLGDTGYKLTMSRYYTPSDANIDKIGVAPDLEVKEPQLTPEEEASLSGLIDREVFAKFAREKPQATESEIRLFVLGLKAAGSPLTERVLIKMLRNQLFRTTMAPAYDLDYDLQLNAALEILAGGQFKTLVSSARSVRELQELASNSKP